MKSFDKYKLILEHFRKNSRISLTELSKRTKIPVSTLFEKLKLFEDELIIKKHTSLLDFPQLGYDVRTQVLIEANNKEELQVFLKKHPKINSVFRINNGFDFLIEAVFTNMGELDAFLKELGNQKVKKTKEYFVLEDVKREGFMEHVISY
jgi:DNA-binding Lrp family transcriptional regulator